MEQRGTKKERKKEKNSFKNVLIKTCIFEEREEIAVATLDSKRRAAKVGQIGLKIEYVSRKRKEKPEKRKEKREKRNQIREKRKEKREERISKQKQRGIKSLDISLSAQRALAERTLVLTE